MDIKINVTVDDKQLAAILKTVSTQDTKQLDLLQTGRIAVLENTIKLIAQAIGCADHANEANIVECAGTVRTERDIVDDRCKEQNQKIKDLILKVAGLEATISNLNIELEDAKREKVFAENLVKYPNATSRDYTGAPMDLAMHGTALPVTFDAEQPHDPPAEMPPSVAAYVAREEPEKPFTDDSEIIATAEPPKEDIPEGLRSFELGLDKVKDAREAAAYWHEKAASVPSEWHERAKTSLVLQVATATGLEPSEASAMIKKETQARKAAPAPKADASELGAFKIGWAALTDDLHTEPQATKLIMQAYAKQVDGALTFHKSDGERAASEVAEFTGLPRAGLLNKLTSAAAKIFSAAAKVKLAD